QHGNGERRLLFRQRAVEAGGRRGFLEVFGAGLGHRRPEARQRVFDVGVIRQVDDTSVDVGVQADVRRAVLVEVGGRHQQVARGKDACPAVLKQRREGRDARLDLTGGLQGREGGAHRLRGEGPGGYHV